jgi:hypothetical protein
MSGSRPLRSNAASRCTASGLARRWWGCVRLAGAGGAGVLCRCAEQPDRADRAAGAGLADREVPREESARRAASCLLRSARYRGGAPTTGKQLAAKESRGKDLSRETLEGIKLKTVYGPDDAADIDSGYPGLPPYTRGPYATMYAGRPWTIRQYAGFSTAEESQRLLPPQPRRGAEGALASPSISPPTAATTATIRASPATSARRAWRSTASRT